MTLSQKVKAPALCIFGAVMLTLIQPAAAAPLFNKSVAGPATTKAEPVRYRGGHHGWHRGHQGWRHRYRRGPALGAVAAGVIIGSAIASSEARAASADAYCERRFRSYESASGTYLGYDGERHACP